MTLIQIFEDMKLLGENAKDTEFTPAELTRFIRNIVGNSDTKVATSRDSNVDMDQIVIGGIYDPHDDEAGVQSITLYVTYNPDQKRIKIANLDWTQICIDLIECTGHEFIHQKQYRSRNFDIGSYLFVSGSDDDSIKLDQNYLGNPDEIDAYAYSIAVEIYLKYRPRRLSLKYIQQTAMHKAYCTVFGKHHAITKQLTGYVDSYYTQLLALPV